MRRKKVRTDFEEADPSHGVSIMTANGRLDRAKLLALPPGRAILLAFGSCAKPIKISRNDLISAANVLVAHRNADYISCQQDVITRAANLYDWQSPEYRDPLFKKRALHKGLIYRPEGDNH